MVFVIILLGINLLLHYFQNQILWVFFFEDCRLFLVTEKMKENLKRIKWNVRRELTFLYDLRLECLLFLLFAREGFGWDFWERKLINDGYFWYFHFCYVVSIFTQPDMEDQDSRRCIVIGFFLEPDSSLHFFFFFGKFFEPSSRHWVMQINW